MSEVLDLKTKKKAFGLKEIIVIVVSVVFTTVGIKATDKLLNSNNEEEEGICPKNMVLVSYAKGDFCIDMYEASPNDACVHSNPDNNNDTRINLDVSDCVPESKPNVVPWRNISQDQAVLACAKAGKRLPTYDEWFYAALGTPDKEEDWGPNDCHVDENWSSQPGLTGSGEYCKSSVGAYDMIGNVWEWVNGSSYNGKIDGKELPESGYIDAMDGGSLPSITDKNNPNINYKDDYFWMKTKGARGMSRGGYWQNKSDAGQYAIYLVSEPSYSGKATGFRCVK